MYRKKNIYIYTYLSFQIASALCTNTHISISLQYKQYRQMFEMCARHENPQPKAVLPFPYPHFYSFYLYVCCPMFSSSQQLHVVRHIQWCRRLLLYQLQQFQSILNVYCIRTAASNSSSNVRKKKKSVSVVLSYFPSVQFGSTFYYYLLRKTQAKQLFHMFQQKTRKHFEVYNTNSIQLTLSFSEKRLCPQMQKYVNHYEQVIVDYSKKILSFKGVWKTDRFYFQIHCISRIHRNHFCLDRLCLPSQ